MKTNLVETVKFCFTEEVITQLANALGESEERVKNGLAQAVPLVLNGILQQAEQEGNPSALLHRAREVDAATAPAQFANLADASWYEQGGIILVELLGSTYGRSMSQLAHEAGLQLLAAERLLQLTAAAVGCWPAALIVSSSPLFTSLSYESQFTGNHQVQLYRRRNRPAGRRTGRSAGPPKKRLGHGRAARAE